jgi:predicted RNA binding protein YcfA (HicA-like mRNA interferase family)
VTKLPAISGRDTVKALRKIGYEIDHQTGSHMILRRTTYPFRRLTIPDSAWRRARPAFGAERGSTV